MDRETNQENKVTGSVTDSEKKAGGAGSYANALYVRAVKIASALHVVTNLMSDREPIRTEIRGAAVDLIHGVSTRSSASFLERGEMLSTMRELMERITALLEVSGSAGLMSAMNADLLKGEVEKLARAIEDERNWGPETSLFSLDVLLKDQSVSSLSTQSSIGHDTEITPVSDRLSPSPFVSSSSTRTFKSPSSPVKTNISVTDTKNTRRDLILSVVRKTGEVSLSDMKLAVKGVSDKTLQRELAALVADGLLKRIGDRRWTKYRIVG